MSSLSRKANRILTMIPLIRSRPGIRIEEIARQLGVPPKTILSDLDAILMCGVPPYLPNDYVGVYVENNTVRLSFADHFKRPVTLTHTEALALRLALECLPARTSSHASKLIRKLNRLLPRVLRRDVKRRFRLAVGQAAVRERMRTIERAVALRREIHIEYYTASRDTITERTVQPYAIIEHQGQWYLIAFCRMRHRELPFRIDRIRSAKLTGESFTVPESFDIETYRRPEMYFPTDADIDVEVRLMPEFADRVRGQRPEETASLFGGQPAIRRTRSLPDGSLVFTIAVTRPEWIVSWALQHGEAVEILSPPDVREKVRAACDGILAVYE
jgi:proteasome accessory factor C